MPPLPALSDIENEKLLFKSLTHELNNYNEIFNLNAYMTNSGNQENMKLQKTNEVLKGQNMKLKQEYILQEWNMSYMNLKNNLMYFSICVVAIILMVAGLFLKEVISKTIAVVITAVISVFFIIAVVVVVKNNSDRRNVLWDHYYFGPMKSD
jgi:hypothetical protein